MTLATIVALAPLIEPAVLSLTGLLTKQKDKEKIEILFKTIQDKIDNLSNENNQLKLALENTNKKFETTKKFLLLTMVSNIICLIGIVGLIFL